MVHIFYATAVIISSLKGEKKNGEHYYENEMVKYLLLYHHFYRKPGNLIVHPRIKAFVFKGSPLTCADSAHF